MLISLLTQRTIPKVLNGGLVYMYRGLGVFTTQKSIAELECMLSTSPYQIHLILILE